MRGNSKIPMTKEKREACFRELKNIPASRLAELRAMIFTPEGGPSRLRMAGDPPGPGPGVALRDSPETCRED